MSEENVKLISPIMSSDKEHEWHEANVEKPESFKPLIIRITRDDIELGPGGDVTIHPEDMKIAQYKCTDDKCSWYWEIMPPYTKYESNALTNGPYIIEPAYVSHWAEPVGDEVNNYINRFDIKGSYNNLLISIDADHETLLYYTILQARFLMDSVLRDIPDKNSDKYRSFEEMCILLDDIQNCMDRDICVIDGKEYKRYSTPGIVDGSNESDDNNDINHNLDNQEN